MSNSSIQCKICYKFLKNTTSDVNVRENKKEEDRRKLLSLCSEYLFNELCDWQTICHKETLPFCVECREVIEKIKVLDGKLKSEKNDISDLSEQFTVKVLRLRNQRQRDEVYPKIFIKTEKGLEVEQKITCKICRGIYNEQPLVSNDSLDLTLVAKVIRICKKYLFSEIFDDGCLDLNIVARLNLLPFCFDCCVAIHDICQKSDLTDNISAEIEKLVNRFALKILNHRKNGKLIGMSDDVVIKVSLSPTPDSSPQNFISTTGGEAESEEDCMIVDVLPVGVERNALNSLCHKLKGNKQPSPGESYMRQAFPAKTPEKIPFPKDVHYLRGGRLPDIGTEASPPPPNLEPMVNASNVTIDLNSSSLETGTVEGEEEPILPEETPGPSKSTNRRLPTRNELGGSYECQNCGAVFLNNFNWLSHIDVCLEGGKILECETCGQCFADSLSFNEHVNSHVTVNSNTNRSLGREMAEERGNWNQHECGITGVGRHNLRLGVNSVLSAKGTHNQNKSYKCPKCSRPFVRRNHLKNHLRGNLCFSENMQISRQTVLSLKRVRTSKKKSIIRMVNSRKGRIYSCTMCPLTFTHSIIFSKHLQTHYDIATIRCDSCRMVFNSKSSKKMHVYRIHSGKFQKNPRKNRNDRPTTQENRDLQIQRVDEYEVSKDSGENQKVIPEEDLDHQIYNNLADPEYSPKAKKYTRSVATSKFTCSVCGMGFGRIMHLRHHLQTHYDEAPFRCTTCKRVLTNHRSLSRHMLNVHSIADY